MQPVTRNSLFTVGHSNRPLSDFLAILETHAVQRILDVRRYPTSRKWPHFDAEALGRSLVAAGRDYVGLPELGGRRRPKQDSPHIAWRNKGFRGYADFMDSSEFAAGLQKAMALAASARSVLLCAEALPWKCHRSMIADALTARGWSVVDVLSERETREHRLPPFARLEGTRVVYDGRRWRDLWSVVCSLWSVVCS